MPEASAPACPGEEERERTRAAVARFLLLGTVGALVLAVLVGLVIGLALWSLGWGLVAGAAFLGLELVVAVVALAAQGQLRGAGRLYAESLRRAVTGSPAG
ncbi:MAG TPA: hypothetical protein VMU09_02520 [Acidimicrobiales bacterium]|nr:hypothetical protein [Acidimicrobiales bacterium]